MRFNFIAVILALLLENSFKVASLAACPSGWIQHESICYFFSTDKFDWVESEEFCKLFSSKLAEPRTASAANFITSHVQKLHDNFWLGISDALVENNWIYTSDMSPLQVNNWLPGDPNGHTRDNCVITWINNNGLWGDIACSNKFKFICERPESINEVLG